MYNVGNFCYLNTSNANVGKEMYIFYKGIITSLSTYVLHVVSHQSHDFLFCLWW